MKAAGLLKKAHLPKKSHFEHISRKTGYRQTVDKPTSHFKGIRREEELLVAQQERNVCVSLDP